ncbi:capsular polysaccharide export protein, LipB/KpsS family [Winogradskyella sp.]|uniref:capsular polysaccharide export protein, LipB/KpsS family n=1 Tax=Winogradskyella sp. TaxID=1883156 RepID=UPI003F6AC134
MKIICFSTFDKFSRFYLDIERNLKTKYTGHIIVKIYSLYFSGFLYTFLRFKFSSWISLKAWRLARKNKNHYKEIIETQDQYKGLYFNNLTKFHVALDDRISTEALQLQALAYIDVFDTIYSKFQPDYIISIGDSRMCIEIGIALAKLKNITVFYIEQGPFNTTFFDNKGVNANISIREDFKTLDLKEDANFSSIAVINKTKKYNRSPLYRGLDMIIKSLFEKTRFYPPDLKFTDINSYTSKRWIINKEHSSTLHKPIYLLILQVPLDVNMICHSPFFKTHLDIVKSVYKNLPEGIDLVIREHPLYIKKYESELYDFVSKNNILIDNLTNLDESLKTAKVVIVNNSTVGIEALLNYKTVVVLGNAFYDDKKIVLKLKSKDELKVVLESALKYQPNKINIDNFKALLFNKVLLDGTISDKNLKSSRAIADYIIEDH